MYVQADAQLWSKLINSRNEECHTERPTHHRLLVVHTLSEPQRKIAHGLRHALHLDPLVVCEGVVLGRNARVVDHRTGVGGEAGHGAAEMGVDFHDLFN